MVRKEKFDIRNSRILSVLPPEKKRIRKRKFYPFFSERVFSAAGNTVTPKRANLNPEKVEDLVVVQSNLQLLKSMGMRH